MKYRSTRGNPCGIEFEETMFVGWLKDNSLIIPDFIPNLSKEVIQSWSSHSYQDICIEVFNLFAGEGVLSRNELKSLLQTAFASFPEEIIPIQRITDDAYILELFHGPTHAFKDLALAVAGPLLNLILKRHHKHAIVYVATSGDTGSAVINVTKNLSHIDTITFFPGGKRITESQRLLMTSVDAKNIHNFGGEGHCDQFDVFLRTFIGELQMRRNDLVVTSLNSVIWIRLMMQVAHLAYGYFLASKDFDPIKFVIPTGGGGHLTSAIILKKLGFPIKITTAFNSKNLNFCNFLIGKEMFYDAPVQNSLSPAMDIQLPACIERLLYLITDGNSDLVKDYSEKFYNGEPIKASENLLYKLREYVTTFISSDEDIIETMRKCWKENDYIIDPHTAAGFTEFYRRKSTSSEKTVYCACASPIKFAEVLKLAGIPLPESYAKYFETLRSCDEHFLELPSNTEDWGNFVMKYIDEYISGS